MSVAAGYPGGAKAALTTSEIYLDLALFAGRTLHIWSDADFWYSFAPTGTASGTLGLTAPAAASLTSLQGRRQRAGTKVPRLVNGFNTVLVARTVSGAGTLHVELVSDVGGAADAEAEDAIAPALGTVTISDFVDAQLPSSLGQKTGANSLAVVLSSDVGTVTDGTRTAAVKAASTAAVAADQALVVAISPNKGVPAFTDNAAYITNGNMGGDITGADITIGAEGTLTGYFSWPSTSTPIGRLLLQLRAPDGTTYDEVPGQAAAWANQPTAGAAGASFALFEGLRPGAVVRFKYARTSGGTTNSLQGQTRV